MHNETGNIYTHLIPAFYMIYQLILLNRNEGPYAEYTTDQSYWTTTISAVVILICMTLSSIYHTYNPISQGVYLLLYRMDLIGIGIMIFGLTICSCFLGFHNWPTQRDFITSVMLFLLCGNLIIQMTPCYA